VSGVNHPLPNPRTSPARVLQSLRLSSPALRVEPGPEECFSGYRGQYNGNVNMEATELWREGAQDDVLKVEVNVISYFIPERC
jgi:hypothetical protein